MTVSGRGGFGFVVELTAFEAEFELFCVGFGSGFGEHRQRGYGSGVLVGVRGAVWREMTVQCVMNGFRVSVVVSE